ncbi:MAG: FAD-dependent oxidoreductase [Deltaproteobacteria bacterium]|nr:FAD-dependent oxidoreductase [Deltaproteobacteria bacterium]
MVPNPDLVVVGAGCAGLAAAIAFKRARPEAHVVVLEKAAGPGFHNLSGAVLEAGPIHALLDIADPNWRDTPAARHVLGQRVRRDDVLFFTDARSVVSLKPALKAARSMGLGFGGLLHDGDLIVSVSQLTAWLSDLATRAGVEVLHGFPVRDVILDENGLATGIRTIDQGLDHERRPQPNFLPGEIVHAGAVVLAEGPLGYATEDFVARGGLVRNNPPVFSVGIKEIVEVPEERYAKFGSGRVMHALGWPLWTPVVGPAMFGGGILYSMGARRIAVGIIIGADWNYHDFIPQDAYARFKEHTLVQRFIAGGTVVEAGAKMIPEGGFHALPRDPETGAIGRKNVVIVGDSAGFVNVNKIKGLHNAIASGLAAGNTVAASLHAPAEIAPIYTRELEAQGVLLEMNGARNVRQTVARLGNLWGLPLSAVTGLFPRISVEPDRAAMTRESYSLKLKRPFDKDAFVAAAKVEHREGQPIHCEVLDPTLCATTCAETFDRPCVKFCPAGVYEVIQGTMKPVNPTNCVHCKTCQNKCPYDNLRWHPLEGGGGPKWEGM